MTSKKFQNSKQTKNIFEIVFLLFVTLFTSCGHQGKVISLTDDGTWCWFSDPRAILSGNGKLLTGYVTGDGSVAALSFDLNSGEKSISILNEKLEVDDHNNPAFLQRADGHLLAFYTKHHNNDLYMNVSQKPGEASAWDGAVAINPNRASDAERFGDNKYTYANPFKLKDENDRIYLFGRWIGFKPNITWSDDGGQTWSNGRVVVSPMPFSQRQRPYVKYFSDGKSKIHMVFTDGHPRDEPTNSVYYAYYFNGAFHRAGGEVICTLEDLPFEPREATLVYDAKQTGALAWVFDIYADENGQPAIAYARYPTENEHIYHYAWFNGEDWNDKMIVNSGKWFPQTPDGQLEREPHYSGGLTISPDSEHSLFISREVNNIFEIEKWELDVKNDKWKNTPVTQNSQTDQIRPYAVKNTDKTLLLWNSVERYVHYTDYKTGIKLYYE